MSTTNRKKFKGEIENYRNNGLHNFESKFESHHFHPQNLAGSRRIFDNL